MLKLTGVSVTLGGTTIVKEVQLEVKPGEIVALLGPSGAGKSTLLRSIAGLVPLSGGGISWDGAPLVGVAPHERNFGFMFQDYALFPHRNVGRNVGFGLEMRGVSASEIAESVRTSLTWVGLAGTEHRAVASLSGGEQQRVALARALAPNPQLLMLDEPVGSLDRELRTRLIDELAELLRERQVTTIIVTHDQAEAFALADRVAIMRDGHIVACEQPATLWQHPPDEWTAQFLGMSNLVDDPERGRVLIRPEAISLGGVGPSGVVKSATFAEGHYRFVVVTDEGWALSFTSTASAAVGERVTVTIDPAGIVALAD